MTRYLFLARKSLPILINYQLLSEKIRGIKISGRVMCHESLTKDYDATKPRKRAGTTRSKWLWSYIGGDSLRFKMGNLEPLAGMLYGQSNGVGFLFSCHLCRRFRSRRNNPMIFPDKPAPKHPRSIVKKTSQKPFFQNLSSCSIPTAKRIHPQISLANQPFTTQPDHTDPPLPPNLLGEHSRCRLQIIDIQ